MGIRGPAAEVFPRESLRTEAKWGPGTEFRVERRSDGVLLRPIGSFPVTRIEEVAGCLPCKGRAHSIAEMHRAIAKRIKDRHDSGRY